MPFEEKRRNKENDNRKTYTKTNYGTASLW